MDRNEKAFELLERAKQMGIRLEIDHGLLVAACNADGDSEVVSHFASEIMKVFSEVRLLLENRSISARAREFLGKPAWSPEIGECVLSDTGSDGYVIVSTGQITRRGPVKQHISAQAVLILVEEDAGVAGESVQAVNAEKPKRGLLGFLRGSAESGS